MAKRSGERTPLISWDDSSLQQPQHDSSVSRRRGPQHNSPRRTGDSYYSYESSFSQYTTDCTEESTMPARDNDKRDRRSWWSRAKSSCQAGITGSANPTLHREEDAQYYVDDFNEHSWHCTFGTKEEDGVWMNRKDQPGTIMSFMVWLLIAYSGVTVTLLSQDHHLPGFLAMSYCTICALALASHAKTSFTDPGAVQHAAVPLDVGNDRNEMHLMCSHCQTYKPPGSHHCRICARCICHMDHHCPWMNNCVGAGNLKHFILFLCYTWTGSAFALIFFASNYFFCSTEDCTFSVVLVQLVRAMTLMCLGALLFTSSMLMNVTYGVMTGITTIDRLKKKATQTLGQSDEEPVPLKDIFGIGPYWTWLLPMDPLFDDFDRVMGYSTPQRLLREQMREPVKENTSISMKGYSPV